MNRKFFLLFLFLLAYLVLYPYFQGSGIKYLSFRVFGSAITLISVFAVSYRRRLGLAALVLAVPALLHRILLPRANSGVFSLTGTVLSLVFDIFIVVVIFRRVFSEEEPNSEAVFGAICIYLLVGFSFAGLYSMLAVFQPQAFHMDAALNLHSVPDPFDFIYYSFGSMTSLGAAGITPVSDQARSITVIEAILGVLYLAVLVSRLMNAYRTRAVRKENI